MTPKSVWVLKDEMDGECYITVFATRDAAIEYGAETIGEWYAGDQEGERRVAEFRDMMADGGRYYIYTNGDGSLEVVEHEVIGA